MKIKFVQLESQAFLTDLDFVMMSAAERGVYCTLILHLYCAGGKCESNPAALQRLCNCENFEQIWEKIAKKFQTRKGVIRHKRVTQELRRAKKFLQGQRASGLRGDQKRWARHSDPIGDSNGDPNAEPMAKETKGNVIEKGSEVITNTYSSEQALSFSNSVRPGLGANPMSGAVAAKGVHFNEALRSIIRPRNRSDRTCFRNVTNWLLKGCLAGEFTEEIFARVLDLAEEAKTGNNPAAVFMALLKKELRYKNG